MRNYSIALLFCFCSTTLLFSQTQINRDNWKVINSSFLKSALNEKGIPENSLVFEIDFKKLENQFSNAPEEFTSPEKKQELELEIPLPNGEYRSFSIFKTKLLPEALNNKYPEISTYAGFDLNDHSTKIKIDFGYNGFHFQILSDDLGTVYMEPLDKVDKNKVSCFFKKDIARQKDFTCHVTESVKENHRHDFGNSRAGDCQLRIYRLALACTYEYSSFHGGNTANILSEMVTVMNRVNGIYERDASLRMEFIPNNDELIFTEVNDPYTNNSPGDMLGENIETCNDVIGTANYDIGHVFGTQGGGLAYLNAPCGSNKAGGMTGLGNPVGEVFSVDYVAHEMGHQFGATHTFNNGCSGNRSASTAMEPGSGSTIMAYAGICGPNVQNNSDDHFHAISIQQMAIFTNNSSCAEIIDVGNNHPIIQPFQNEFIPISTPFELTALASDPEEDELTYCWEQMDNEIADMPPLSTNTDGPAFRSFSPSASPTRVFPNIIDLVNNASPEWEVLPSVGRGMNFRVSVRDNNSSIGCVEEEDVFVRVESTAGPFIVNRPNSNLTWVVGEEETISWDVANTNNSPIDCENVNIYLSTDGGFNYPVLLAENVPNTGTHTIEVPNEISSTCRVKVKGAGKIFFDISNDNFEIEAPIVPTFLLAVSPIEHSVCGAQGSVEYTAFVQSVAGFNGEVNFGLEGLPAGAVASFSSEGLVPNGESVLTISGLENLTSDEYNLNITASSDTEVKSEEVILKLVADIPLAANLLSPADESKLVSISPALNWEEFTYADEYTIEVSDNPAFSNVVSSSTVVPATFTPNALAENTVYYWRVKAANLCGEGSYSETFSFQTAASSCQTYANNTAVEIPIENASIVNSLISIPVDSDVIDINVSMEIEHTWVGDLVGKLINPAGSSITLFDQAGVPQSQYGCDRDNLLVSFDDEASLTKDDFEESCAGGDYAITGNYQTTVGSLSDFDGISSQGDWTLEVEDKVGEDGGQILNWSIEVCFDETNVTPIEGAALINNTLLQVSFSSSATVTGVYLKFEKPNLEPEDISYTLTQATTSGTLYKDAVTLDVGASFTQADIDAGVITYTHDGGDETEDEFHFDVFDGEGGWNPGHVFQIMIIQNNLAASLSIINESCFEANDGMLTVMVSGGTPAYKYSLDGENFQNENTFDNLMPGNYTVTVKDESGFSIQTSSEFIAAAPELFLSSSVDGNTITVDGSGGTGSLSYNLNGGSYQSSNVFDNLSNGTYMIGVKDENDCILIIEESILVNTLVSAQINVVNSVSCFNESDASISVEVIGGSMPLTYSLNDGDFQMSNFFGGLGSGTYFVVVKDADDFVIQSSEVTIDNPLEINGTVAVDGRTITTDASGGSGSLTYSLDGMNYQSSNVFMNVQNGDYVVYVKDENGCVIELLAVVSSSTFQAASLNLISEIDCYESASGSVSAVAVGGNAPLEYSLNEGPFQPSNFFDMLTAGTYVVTIRDADGFEIVSNEIVLTDPDPIVLTVEVDENNATVNATGGVGGFEYSLDGVNFQDAGLFTSLVNGEYQVFVKDANGCLAEDSFTIVFDNLSALLSIVEQISCADENDGIISIEVSGGSMPYSYSLDGEDFQVSNVFENLAAGTYIVTVMDDFNLIVQSNEVIILNPEPLTASLELNMNTISVNAQGGTGVYMYSINGSAFQSSNEFVNLVNGDYEILVIDENECATILETSILVNTLSVNATLINSVSCHEGMDGSIEVNVSGGSSPYTYSIDGENFQDETIFVDLAAGEYQVIVKDVDGFEVSSNTVVISDPDPILVSAVRDEAEVSIIATGGTGILTYSIDGENYVDQNVFSDLEIGDYVFYVKDENGCIESVSVEVIYNNLSIEPIIERGVSCNGGMDAVLFVDVLGGTGPYEFSLDGENWQTESVFENLSAGMYMISVRDANQFISSQNVLVSEPDPIMMNLLLDANDLTVEASGGVSPFEFSLDGVTFQSSNMFNGLMNGEYTVMVRDANGCIVSEPISILLNNLSAQAQLESEILCFGETTSVVVEVEGGTMPYEYSLDGEDFQTANIIEEVSAGTYDIIIRDAMGLEFIIVGFIVSQPEELILEIATSDFTIIASGSGGSGTLEYSLDGENYSKVFTFSGLSNGEYTVYLKDENECVVLQVVTLNTVPIINISIIESQDLLCAGDENGIIHVEASGGLQPYEYSIDGENYFASGLFENLPGGNYNVSVRDANGVSSMMMININEPNLILLTVEVVVNNIEISASGGTGMYQYTIDGGTTYQDLSIFEKLPNGTYLAGAIDENGCTNFVEVVVNTTSIDYVKDVWAVNVFPNPSSGIVNIKWSDLATDLSLNLTTINGEALVLKSVKDQASITLDLSTYPNGVYLLKLNDGINVGVIRLVKQ